MTTRKKITKNWKLALEPKYLKRVIPRHTVDELWTKILLALDTY